MTANANAYDYRQALDLYRQFFTLHFFTVALAIGYSVYQLYWDRLSAYVIWFGFTLINSRWRASGARVNPTSPRRLWRRASSRAVRW